MTAHPERSVAAGNQHDELLVERLDPQEMSERDYHGAQQDLADRQSLRRVAGMSTELQDVTEVEYRRLQLERVVLVGVWTSGSQADAERSLAELKLLAETAGSQVLDGLIQRRTRPDPATYIGRGKVDELRELVIATGADTVICDGELAAAQLRNLEDRIQIKVIDRTALILDIFAAHAKSAEGKAQVELAQLQYLRQRLRGWGGNLSRQAGGRAGGGSTAGSPSCDPVCGRWTAPARPSARSGGGTRCRRSPSSATPTPASPA